MIRRFPASIVGFALLAGVGCSSSTPTAPASILPAPIGGSLTGGLLVMVPIGLFPGESDNAVAQVSSTKDGITSTESTTQATWVSSNPSVATITPSGRVTAVAPGTSRLTATYQDKSASAVLSVSTVDDIVSVDVLCPSPLRVGERFFCFSNARLTTGATTSRPTFEWSSTRPDVVAVDALGGITARSAGEATVTASYRGRQGTARVLVTPE